MPELPRNLPGFDRYYAWFRNGAAGRLLIASARAGVFTALAGAKSAAGLALELGLHPATLKSLLDILVVLGLLVRDGPDGYRNTAEATSLFSADSYANVLRLLEEVRLGVEEPMADLPRLLREGPPPADPAMLMNSLAPEVWAASADGSAAWALRGAGLQAARIIAGLPGSRDFSLMLDLGGGPGVFGLYAASLLPGLRVTVLDSAPVLEVAKKYIREHGFGDRVVTAPLDYFKDPLPGGADIVLASCTLNLALPDRLGEVVGKIYDSLNPGGYFVSLHDSWPDEPEEEGRFTLEYPLHSLLTGVQVNMPAGLVASTALDRGFRQVRSKDTLFNGGILAVDVARK
ncbi:MAG: methyltransferase domain-containing protein [Deltaproteobacteria bacterium]|jgi:SAM-dependent methyltransferase|nr:methyltransferase domain-containing protein [Deltaproteobacteria bacterium]